VFITCSAQSEVISGQIDTLLKDVSDLSLGQTLSIPEYPELTVVRVVDHEHIILLNSKTNEEHTFSVRELRDLDGWLTELK